MFIWNPNITYLVIDGIIGAGKTELTRAITNTNKWISFDEPAELATNPYLDDFYKVLSGAKANEGEPILMQLYLLNKRFQAHRSISYLNQSSVQDRSIWGDKIFAELLYEDGFIHERDYRMYLEVFESLAKDLVMPSIIFFLDVKPQTALLRIHHRGKLFEQNISIEYLTKLDQKYREWLDWMEHYTVVHRFPYDEKEFNGDTVQEILEIVESLKKHDKAKQFLTLRLFQNS